MGLLEGQVSQLLSYICGCRSSEAQKKTLDETRRKHRTDLPTSQSQVIAFFLDINCILDLLSKMSSSPHHISGPVQCLPHLHAGLCRGDGEQFQLTWQAGPGRSGSETVLAVGARRPHAGRVLLSRAGQQGRAGGSPPPRREGGARCRGRCSQHLVLDLLT